MNARKADCRPTESASCKWPSLADYERMADDYAANPVRVQRLSDRWKSV